MSELLTELPVPDGWRLMRLEDVCHKVTDGTHKTPNYRESGIRFISIKNIRPFQPINRESYEKYISLEEHKELTKRCRPEYDDILFPRIGTLGFAKRIDFEDEVSIFVGLGLLKPKKELIRPKFLELWMNSPLINQLSHQRANGSGRLTLPLEESRIFPVLLPPLEEQDQIVELVEQQFTRLEAGVAGLRRVQANLKRYRAAVLKAACEGKLVPTEAEWCHKPLMAGVRSLDQGWSPRCEIAPSDDEMTWAVIKTTAIQPSRFVEIENKKLPQSLKPRPTLELVAGDLLVTRAGPRSRVGVACVVKKTRPRLMLCDKAYRVKCHLDIVNPAFLEVVLNAPQFVDAINALKTGINDSGLNLTQKRFGGLVVPFPSLSEQQRIVGEVERRVSVVEELEAVINANLRRTSRLRQSTLQRAFEGQFTLAF